MYYHNYSCCCYHYIIGILCRYININSSFCPSFFHRRLFFLYLVNTRWISSKSPCYSSNSTCAANQATKHIWLRKPRSAGFHNERKTGLCLLPTHWTLLRFTSFFHKNNFVILLLNLFTVLCFLLLVVVPILVYRALHVCVSSYRLGFVIPYAVGHCGNYLSLF